ncbi:hypothetical protein NLI96_g3486 [Meripilus lineatus]|uniref:Uncharacterized protein n=1 Tax=Meripilus lineatus TaxID=2056292 RepID=A0AAD5V6X1_9APHY|nr:hypothetical protein NLI96_g3486 [Physisporinus lineatus]
MYSDKGTDENHLEELTIRHHKRQETSQLHFRWQPERQAYTLMQKLDFLVKIRGDYYNETQAMIEVEGTLGEVARRGGGRMGDPTTKEKGTRVWARFALEFRDGRQPGCFLMSALEGEFTEIRKVD